MLMTDNAFGSIRTRAIKDHLTQRPLTMDGRSWVPVFDSLGIVSERVSSLAAVEQALSHWNPAGGPMFLEVPFQPDPYEAMVKDIR
jgi:thiamine pyrophosphate-dependent acetolactate synthase large subunit-like protein